MPGKVDGEIDAVREIVLDTETTGLDPKSGHRVVEIGCLELIHNLPTGRTFQAYINPERDMPAEAEAIHGLGEAFLAEKPVFAALAQDFLDFIGEAKLVIHNAGFDMKFLNWELKSAGFPLLEAKRAIDTVALARSRFPGQQVSLDALCRRFGVDNSSRDFHGALLDCQLLAEVYLELLGGREPGFSLDRARETRAAGSRTIDRKARPARPHQPSDSELAAHAAMLERISDPVWRD